jgi:cadherin EGF LAG seven-pass G-type receptor 1
VCIRINDFLKALFDVVSIILQNIVQTASSILDMKYRDHWDRITDLTGETAEDLVLSVDKYIATLAKSQEDTYTSPFEVVADNMGESSSKSL